MADTDAVDEQLGIHVDATPQVAATDGGVIDAGDEGEVLTDSDEGRPEDCDCWATGELACWPCFRDGFTEQNPDVNV